MAAERICGSVLILIVFLSTFMFISVKYERIKFLVIALKSSVEVYAWAPKPYHKFMAFKVKPPVLNWLKKPEQLI